MAKKAGFLIDFFCTCCYVGKSKIAPGTFGSFVAFFFLPFISTNLIWLILFIILFIIGVFASGRYAYIHRKDDPKEVVIDEFVAQGIVFYAINYIIEDVSIYLFVLSFVFFRFFDILKPFPIYVIDQKLKGGFGIMFDDFVAAIFAIISTIIIYFCIY